VIRNDDATISIADASVTEGDSGTVDIQFLVALPFGSTQTVTVDFATADGSAAAGTDYMVTSGTLTFNPGEIEKTITITVNGDTAFEADETFFVDLLNPNNATLSDPQGRGDIINDDSTISIDDVTVIEGDSGTVDAVFTVSLSAATTQTVTVQATTADDTAS